MEQHLDNEHLTCRPARAQDKARVLEFTAHTWGEHGDYIHEVWDAWLADPQGELSVVEWDGQVAAMAKLSVLSPGEMWLEGLRVDEAYRKKGIAAALHAYHTRLIERLGGRVVRYATGQNNVASHHIAEQNGFKFIASYVEELLGEPDPAVRPPDILAEDDWPSLQAALRQAIYLPQASGLYEQEWKWGELHVDRLRAHLAHGQVVGLKQPGEQLSAWAIVTVHSYDKQLRVHLIEGQGEALVDLARALRGYAAQAGKDKAEITPFEADSLLEALKTAGYTLPDPFSMHIFEKRLQR